MKKQWIIWILIMSAFSLFAQTHRRDAFYFSLEGSPLLGSFIGLDLSANYQLKQSFSFSFGLNTGTSMYKKFDARKTVNAYYFKMGKVFPAQDETLRWNLSVGVGYSHINYPVNSVTEHRTGWFIIPFDYTHTEVIYENSEQITFIVNPKVEFLSTSGIGLTVSAIYMTNHIAPVFGLGIGMMLGN